MAYKDEYEEVPTIDEKGSRVGSEPGSAKQHRLCIAFHLILVCLYTVISFAVIRQRERPTTSLAPISNLDICYQPKNYTDFELSDYAGLPSPLLDEKWHDLLEHVTLRVSKEELQKSNQTSVALPRGGYMAWLGVSHELHCIKTLRQWNYRDHYHSGLDEDHVAHWNEHAGGSTLYGYCPGQLTRTQIIVWSF